jgi:3-methylfumaryl-CoA hydratase
MESDAASLQDWIGRTTEADDIVTPRLVRSLHATLTPHAAGLADGAPPGLHWCLAPDIADAGELGPDGHPAKGGLLPPVPLPRRMWAGSDLRMHGHFAAGDRVRRRSEIAKVEEKLGRSGSLIFVTIRHSLSNAIGPVVEEDQILVYREAAAVVSSPPPRPDLPPALHERTVVVDPVLLFRYSALTFNGHRVHYDFPYSTEAEQYPGLVIHGPLQATLLLNLAALVHGRPPKTFSFRGTHPATGTQKLTLRANPGDDSDLDLAVQAAEGHVTMKATAQW